MPVDIVYQLLSNQIDSQTSSLPKPLSLQNLNSSIFSINASSNVFLCSCVMQAVVTIHGLFTEGMKCNLELCRFLFENKYFNCA